MHSLLKSIIVIRKHGLKHRIKPPEEFMNNVNNLSIEMTNTRRKSDSKKARKEVFRKLKRLAKIIRAHAGRYYELLKNQWRDSTDLSEGHVNKILERIDNILTKLPEAVKQAHSRIITGLQVKSKDKILSLFMTVRVLSQEVNQVQKLNLAIHCLLQNRQTVLFLTGNFTEHLPLQILDNRKLKTNIR